MHGTGETAYGYYQGGDQWGNGYKMWKKSCEKDGCPGYYNVYEYCTGHVGMGGTKRCYLNFWCVESWSIENYGEGKLYYDC